jgi:zinc protease
MHSFLKITRFCLMFVLPVVPLGASNSMKQNTPPAGSVLKATLSNGLQVVIVRDPLAPVVTTVMNYRVGSDEAPTGFPGTAHAQEHMMFRGSPGLSADQLAAIGADMGGDFNADTEQSVTQYTYSLPADDLDVALHVEAIRMQAVLDTDALWKAERGAIEQEVARDLSNPEYVFYTRLQEILFHGTPYQHDALGTRPSFDRTTGEMLQKFHTTWYAPNNTVLVITGGIQPQAVLAQVKSLFDDIPARTLPARPDFHFAEVQPETIRMNTDLPYGVAVVAFRTPGDDSPDYAALQVMSDVLSSQRSSLYALGAEGKALETGFSFNALPRAGIAYALAAYPAGGGGARQLQQLHAVLADDLKNGFPPELVEAARRDALTQAELRKNSISGLAMDWSEAVAIEGRESPDVDVAAIQRVTPADVNRVARQYLNYDHAVQAILTPQTSGKAITGALPKGPESFAAAHVKPVALPVWARQTLMHLAVPPSDVHPVASALPNGLKLIVLPETVSDTVSVYGHIRNNEDMEAPPGKEGISSVVEDLFEYGTQSLDRLSFQKALDDIGAEESAGTDFSLQVLGRHFERGVELLADNELHPAFPDSDFRIVRDQVAGTVAGRLHSPSYLEERALETRLFPKGDPSLRRATPASVNSLTLASVNRYFHRVYRPDLTTIVVIGNITPQAARATIEKYFGGWTATGRRPPTVPPAVPPNAAGYADVPDATRIQDEVTMGEMLGINRYNPDYYALELGNNVLGGGFYATRFYRDLRETAGLVYTVSSDLDVGRTRGIYEVEFGAEPGNVARAAAMVRRELQQMQASPVSAEELRQAKTLLLAKIPLDEASEDDIAEGLLSRSNLDLPLDEPTVAARHYLLLTAEEVRAAFARHVRPDAMAEIVQGPAQ